MRKLQVLAKTLLCLGISMFPLRLITGEPGGGAGPVPGGGAGTRAADRVVAAHG